MTLLAVPNVSEGRSVEVIDGLSSVLQEEGARVLDVHVDADHNRSVITTTAEPERLVDACVALARAAARAIDLRIHDGVHPRVGALDVCPFVPHNGSMDDAVSAAREAAALIGEEGLPVFLYGAAATREELTHLPAIRRGGLAALIERSRHGLLPDAGPRAIDPKAGVVCVGARGPLIAFNVWLDCELAEAREIASGVRSEHVRALGLELGPGKCQVSMNLVQPSEIGIETAYEEVAALARGAGLTVVATEIVGVPERRYLPGPETEAARLLLEPGPSLEDLLQR